MTHGSPLTQSPSSYNVLSEMTSRAPLNGPKIPAKTLCLLPSPSSVPSRPPPSDTIRSPPPPPRLAQVLSSSDPTHLHMRPFRFFLSGKLRPPRCQSKNLVSHPLSRIRFSLMGAAPGLGFKHGLQEVRTLAPCRSVSPARWCSSAIAGVSPPDLSPAFRSMSPSGSEAGRPSGACSVLGSLTWGLCW